MRTLAQRVGDRLAGGVMTDLKCMLNGPVSCPPNVFTSRLGRTPPLAG